MAIDTSNGPAPTVGDASPPLKENTARVVRSGALLDLADDPLEHYQHHFIQIIERNLDPADRPLMALDLAAGAGHSTLTLFPRLPAGSRVVALSEERADIKLFHERLSKSQRQQIFPRKEKPDRLAFATGVFDVAWAALANEQLQPARAVIRATLRVLKPNGLLLIAAPLRATFGELVRTVGPSLKGHEDNPAFASLVAEPANLTGAEGWETDMHRSGAIEVSVLTDTIEATLTPPLSRQPLFTRHLLPIWVGNDVILQTQALGLLDETVKEPFSVAVHIGCIRGRRGMRDIEEPVDA